MRIRPIVLAGALIGFPALGHPAAAQDLSGVWMRQPPGSGFSTAPPPQMTAWAAARFSANKPTVGPNASLDSNDPTLDCAPPGVPYILAIPTPFEIVQMPGEILQLFEYNHFVRRIHTDGRGHPADLRDTGTHEWSGHSIGWWEGDTFVIDTIGFNDETWLDRLGHPHSDALHVVERLRRLDHDTLQYEVTVEDPKAYVSPWAGRMSFSLRPDWEILEHVCTTRGDEYLEYKRRAWERPAQP
jgi:hypothetical protein